MLMKFGEYWHCMNPACHCEVLIAASGAVEGLNPRCACGSVMKKRYRQPTVARDDAAPPGKDPQVAISNATLTAPEQPMLAVRGARKE